VLTIHHVMLLHKTRILVAGVCSVKKLRAIAAPAGFLVDRAAAPVLQGGQFPSSMPALNNRALILGVTLLTGLPALPGPAGAGAPRESGGAGEVRPRAEVAVASLGESPDRFPLALGLALPPVKPEGDAVGSEAAPADEPTSRPEPPFSLAQEPVLSILPLLP